MDGNNISEEIEIEIEGNNISGKIEKDRNAWMEMEGNLLKELKKNPDNIKKIKEYNKENSHILYNRIIELIEEIESGKLENEKIYKNVEEITLLFAAIEDVQRERQKQKLPEREDKQPEEEKKREEDRNINNKPHSKKGWKIKDLKEILASSEKGKTEDSYNNNNNKGHDWER